MKKNNLLKQFVYLLLFYIIYSPSLSSKVIFDKNITIPIITIILVTIYMALNKRQQKIYIKKDIFIFCFTIIISNLYYFFIYGINNSSFSFIDSRLIQNSLVIFYIIIIAIIFSILKKNNYTKKDIIDIIINLSVFQGVTCILMVIFPYLHNIALDLYYRGAEENIYISSARIFGISSDYTYSTPIYHAFISAYVFYCYLKYINRKYLIKSILIAIAVVLNNRTGILILVILLIYYFLIYCIKSKNIIRFFKIIIILIIILFSSVFLLEKFVPSTYNFIRLYINDTKNLFLNDTYSGNYKSLENGLYFPKGYKFITGEGYRVYGKYAYDRVKTPSDIGYVNDMFMGGFIYCTLLYGAYFVFINKSLKNNLILKIPFLITLLIANFKGEAFRASIFLFLIVFICMREEYYEE